MSKAADQQTPANRGLAKAPTGIQGLDEITSGGLPRGRPTLVCGSAGCGKTLLAMEFLVRGATEFDEPGVFMSFEETTQELTQNVRSLGFDLDDLVRQKKLAMDFVRVERNEIEETGEYDLEGLFVRLNFAIDTVGAKRVVLDTIEALFGGLSNVSILRGELRRLFRWLKDKGVTAVITCESGAGTLTKHSLEEYVSDCVIVLDHRVNDQMSTRRLRIVKYRGTSHETNEYPFLIDEEGISVLPVTSLGLQHKASDERISSGIPRLDAMLGGEGYFRNSTVLMSGTAGSGKTSIAAHFAAAACQRGERCLYFAFEESPGQLLRNMRSIGIDLEPWVKKGLLQFHASRAAIHGLEMHLATIHKLVRKFQPRGMAHSNQLREFLLTDQGVELQNVYLGAEGVLTGSARQTREATEKAACLLRHQEVEAKQRERVLKREAQEARIIALQKEFEAEEEVAKRDSDQEQSREETNRQDRDRMGISRQGDKVVKDPEPSARSHQTPRIRT